MSLTVTGPEARHLAGLGDDNLVLRATRLLQARDGIAVGAALSLCKHLPVASGIGGGSSDAAAALRALAALWHCRLDPDDSATVAWAATLGADVPACLAGGALWVGGIGEELAPVDGFPGLAVVLANPRIALPTAAVFRARSGGFGPPSRLAPVPHDAVAFAAALARCRNDLTDAAIGLVPEIGRVLEALARLPGALLARMSGSGATCFALFTARDTARHAAELLARAEPDWWVRDGALLAPPPRPSQPEA